ncbi:MULTISPECIES: AAA family ATPase [Methylobacterium]|uniref:AAA family ATPase n=1 Tax=Methylobacterium TaxID=407 RepID=UPI0008E37ADE|nr:MULTISPECIES: AAA family ATPase [Methylobacterium]MBZ6415980.1 AAA family ATPase [Methylobacterium sp.]MBK3399382.1 AAA family ATPase [Methylobacterium ajmalii]MBK3412555.1 AAA family ATPase [Methylobacterium ajmalii]MBK3423149.1 AAA family ATPase [Methylobacterium ajmalii]SFF63783.1 AAA domain-containing protein [Methylobacterium sp. yr596]
MRVRHLHLNSFKNLRGFEINFADAFTNVLVGPNGTGKSNVLEALIIIFRDLDLGAPPAFAYRLEYTCRGADVKIDADPSRKKTLMNITVNGQPVSAKRFTRRAGGEYLPSFVFGYYSGPSNRMESHFAPHQRAFAADLLAGVDRPLRPLLYARLVHSQFVLLSFFRREEEDRRILDRFLRVRDLESVLFVLKKPAWFNKHRRGSGDDPGDPRFWGARGVVRDLLARLYDLSLAPLRSRNGDRLYLFLKNKADLMELAKNYPGQQEFFKALESLYISDLIEDVRTGVDIVGVDNSLTFRELSEGEQQLLMVLGLLKFIEEEEGLIFLDEPDTHLNPAWSIEYTKLLKDHIKDQSTSQIVMTTHDPLVVASLTASEVSIMHRSDNGQVVASHPEEDPKGMGVAALLTSELYGLRSSLDPETLSALDRKRELATKDNLSDDERRQLGDLNERLGSLDFTTTVRDPLYKPFVNAMSRLEIEMGMQAALLTPEQIKERERLADRVIELLLRGE